MSGREALMRDLWENVVPRIVHGEQPQEKVQARYLGNTQKDVEDLKLLLFNVHSNPLSSMTLLYEKTGMSCEKGNRMKGLAVRCQLVVEENIQTERNRGKTMTCLVLTEKAYQFLGIHGKTGGRGGELHRALQQEIDDRFKKMKLDSKVEFEKNGKQVDVGFHLNGQLWAVEVVVTTEKLEHVNLEKDLKAGFDYIMFLTRDTKKQKIVYDNLKNNFPSVNWEKIHVCLFRELFDLVEKEIQSVK